VAAELVLVIIVVVCVIFEELATFGKFAIEPSTPFDEVSVAVERVFTAPTKS
jgi:hypothetical protein